MNRSYGIPLSLCLTFAFAVQPSNAQTHHEDLPRATGSVRVVEKPSIDKTDFYADPSRVDRPAQSVVVIPNRRGPSDSSPARELALSPDADSSSGLFAPIALGITGGTFGFFAGVVAGTALAETSGCDSWGCAFTYPILGAVAGESVGLSSGVYLGTDERGSYLVTLAVGSISALAGLALVNATDSGVLLLGVPIAQLAVTIPTARSGE